MDEMQKEHVQERIVALTRDLILIPSIPARPADRLRCYEFIRNHLEDIDQVDIHEYEHRGIPSLVALPSSKREPDILLCGHLDVVGHPDIYTYHSYVENGRIWGPGAGDMKGSLALMLELFRYFHVKHPGISLGMAVTADEESGGRSGMGYLFGDLRLRSGAAMIPDGGSLNDIIVEEKGILHLKIKFQGHAGHAARPWDCRNPLDAAIDKMTALRECFHQMAQPDRWHPTMAVTEFSTDNKTVNRIPRTCEVVCDIRFTAPFTANEMFEKVKHILGPELDAEILISSEPTHFSCDPLYQQVTEEITGKPARLVREHGGSDARYIYTSGIPIMMSRPLVGNLHAEDEWIDIASMMDFYRIYKTYIERKLAVTP